MVVVVQTVANNPFRVFRPVTCLLLPGWNVTDGREAGEARTAARGGGGGGGVGEATMEGNKCVVLKDNFPITQGGAGGDAPAEYFFWQVRRIRILALPSYSDTLN